MSASSLKFVNSNGTAVKEEVNRKLPKSFYEIERAENMKMASRRLKHDPAIKNKGIMPFAATWLQLEIIILSETNQTEKDKYNMV